MYKKYLVVAEIWDQLCVSNSDMMFSLDINNINVDILLLMIEINIMVFYPTIASKYFVKTRTYVALFGPHQLSIIFSGVMYIELSSL